MLGAAIRMVPAVISYLAMRETSSATGAGHMIARLPSNGASAAPNGTGSRAHRFGAWTAARCFAA